MDGHPLLRDGVAAMIKGQSDIELVDESGSGRDA
jgi:DNA-binding NarL/FixJ family response regulator